MKYILKEWFDALGKNITYFFQSIISIVKVIVVSKYSIKLPQVSGDTCYVLGNGPSLKEVINQKDEFLRNSNLICVNGFPLTEDYKRLQPKYCIFLDPLFYIPEYKDLLPHVKEVLDKFTENTSWQITLLMPVEARHSKHMNEIGNKNPNIQFAYFNYTIVRAYPWLRNLLFKLNLGMPSCHNVVGAAIYLGLNMGFKKVFVLGADHNLGSNLFVDENNNLCVIHHHFYSDGKPKITHAQQFRGTYKKRKLNIADFYAICVKTFNVYYILEDYSKYIKSKVYNATEGSFIDAFERKKIE